MYNTDRQEAYGVPAFCKAHDISRAFFYKLQKEGKGPRFIKLGRRTIVTKEAAAEWRAQLEAEAREAEEAACQEDQEARESEAAKKQDAEDEEAA